MVFRCGQLDSALSEATNRVKTLENKNNLLEIEVVSTLFLLACLGPHLAVLRFFLSLHSEIIRDAWI